MKNAVVLDNVSKIYIQGESKIYALRNVSLKVYDGEFVAVVGPSGSGKSTLLRIIGCLERPTTGKVFLYGNRVDNLDENALAEIRRKYVGFIFQQFNLIPYLTAVENAMLPLVIRGVDIREAKMKALEILRELGIEEISERRPMQMSGGQQQRVAIARAIISNPKIILADEPTGNLDAESAKVVMELLKRLNEEGKTIILVTHNLKLTKYADRVVELEGGKIVTIRRNLASYEGTESEKT